MASSKLRFEAGKAPSRESFSETRKSAGDPQQLTGSEPAAAQVRPHNESLLGNGSLLDGPTQRLYLCAFYVLLNAWRLYDYFRLVSTNADSLWLFMKWVAIDGVFLFALPELHVPWLTWSPSTSTAVFLLHALCNFFLMFRVQIPFQSALLVVSKVLYDRELAISERSVKAASILKTSNLISGKQIVHILPEGLAALNPRGLHFCVGEPETFAYLPIVLNQSRPLSITLTRSDLFSIQNETIEISPKTCGELCFETKPPTEFGNNARILFYAVRQPGIYSLAKVIDESHLEVRRRTSDAIVAPCPSAAVEGQLEDRCRGQLSDFVFSVTAIPPLLLTYGKTINGKHESRVQLTVYPDKTELAASTHEHHPCRINVKDRPQELSWARPHTFRVPVNESMGVAGDWKYWLDELQDGCGNRIPFALAHADPERRQWLPAEVAHRFKVHDRPQISFKDCSSEAPIRTAKGKKQLLGARIAPNDAHARPYHVRYAFKSSTTDKDVPASRLEHNVTWHDTQHGIEAHADADGEYTLVAIGSRFCEGLVLEPSICPVMHPPTPDLRLTSEPIPHRCAGRSIGMRVNLDLIGNPPFKIYYDTRRDGGSAATELHVVSSMRSQLELRPWDAGHYSYAFRAISDAVYTDPRSFDVPIKVEQDVRPTAWAQFTKVQPMRDICLDETVTVPVRLSGDAPWTLEWSLARDGSRLKQAVQNVTSNDFDLTTPTLSTGGRHTLSLLSVRDRSGCSIPLEDEIVIDARYQRPNGGFDRVDGTFSALALEGKPFSIPLRLSGEGPWDVTFQDVSQGQSSNQNRRIQHANAFIKIERPGRYRLVAIRDRDCKGVVDQEADVFEVQWISRPSIDPLLSSPSTEPAIKDAICEGDPDSLEFRLTGKSPFDIRYSLHAQPLEGPPSVKSRDERITADRFFLDMDTSRAGKQEYRILQLGDRLYDRRATQPLIIEQTVHRRPTARFEDAHRSYHYCKARTEENEAIPILLSGKPPFSFELVIKPFAGKTETLPLTRINQLRYELRLPDRVLGMGLHIISIQKLRDGNGCQQNVDLASPSIHVHVVDPPTLTASDPHEDFCVGDRVSFILGGAAPFSVFYSFEGGDRKAKVSGSLFRRIAEKPGVFQITGISDKSSGEGCQTPLNVTKTIHQLPSVRVSRGKTTEVEIHEGGHAELAFEFGGTPPFEFTFTRSTNAGKGKPSAILETRTEIAQESTKTIQIHDEGTYEVIAIRDRYCSVTSQAGEDRPAGQSQIIL